VSHGMVKHEFMGTWAWFFLIVNLSKLPVVAGMGMITTATLQFSLFTVAFLVLGAVVGKRLFQYIPQWLFDPLVLALATVAALRMVAGAIC
ncbi:MAG: hypothetical protein PHO07_07940, partial [Pirellulales bacterium]|nr:hypothetical protein [Pirellulales bacterium]